MHWISVALMSAFFYGSYNFFIKLSSEKLDQIVGAVTLQAVALIVGAMGLLILRFQGKSFSATHEGLLLACLAGVAAGLAEISSFYVFSQGVSAARGLPVIIGGSIVCAVLLGIVVLRESIGWRDGAGIALVICGVLLLTSREYPAH
jgi:transporter family protein